MKLKQLFYKSFLLFIGIIIFSFSSQYSYAKVYKLDDIPNVHLLDSTQWVSDPANILSLSERENINSIISNIHRESSVEMAVVVLESIGDQYIEDFANKLFIKWGLGQKSKDNGLLYLIVLDQKKHRLEIGYGLEPIITDLYSANLLKGVSKKYFRNSNYSEGIAFVVSDLQHKIIIAKDDIAYANENGDNDDIGYLPILVLWGFVFIIFLIYSYSTIRKYSSIISPTIARKSYSQLDIDRNNLYMFSFLSIIGLLLMPFIKKLLEKEKKRLESILNVCANCNSEDTEFIKDYKGAGLSPAQSVEQRIGAYKYDLLHCNNCNNNEILRKKGANFNKTHICPNCKNRTVTISSAYANNIYNRSRKLYYVSCNYCNYKDEYREDDELDSSSALATILGATLMGVGRGSSSGGFGGGSFGGGSAGGGGATSSW